MLHFWYYFCDNRIMVDTKKHIKNRMIPGKSSIHAILCVVGMTGLEPLEKVAKIA